jgi:hypothetical protein
MASYGAYALQAARMSTARCAAFSVNGDHVTAHRVATCAGTTVSVPYLAVGSVVMGIVVLLALGAMIYRQPDRGTLLRPTKRAFATPMVPAAAGWQQPAPGQDLRWWTGTTWGPWK